MSDPLAQSVVELLEGLVDGNGATARDFSVRSAKRVDRTAEVILILTYHWEISIRSIGDRVFPADAKFCSSPGEAQGAAEATGALVSQGLQNKPRLEDRLSQGPVRELLEMPNRLDLGVAGSWYCHTFCIMCLGLGHSRCYYCSGTGAVQCTACRGSGKRVCYTCHGSLQARSWSDDGTLILTSCNTCGGTGRAGSCGCCSYGMSACSDCKGNGKNPCMSCSSTGYTTQVYELHTSADVVRHRLPADAPDEFNQALGAVSIRELAENQADVWLSDVWAQGNQVMARYCLRLPHVHVDAHCKSVPIVVHAVGRGRLIPHMPPFLDALLEPLFEMLTAKGAHPEQVIATCQESRVTERLLRAVADDGSHAQAVAREFSNAASVKVLAHVRSSIHRAFDRIGLRVARPIWWLGTPLAAAGACCAGLFDLPQRLVAALNAPGVVQWEHQLLAALALALLPATVLTLIAQAAGKQATRLVVPGRVSRSPRQGFRPPLALVACMACMVISTSEGWARMRLAMGLTGAQEVAPASSGEVLSGSSLRPESPSVPTVPVVSSPGQASPGSTVVQNSGQVQAVKNFHCFARLCNRTKKIVDYEYQLGDGSWQQTRVKSGKCSAIERKGGDEQVVVRYGERREPEALRAACNPSDGKNLSPRSWKKVKANYFKNDKRGTLVLERSGISRR